MSNDPKRKSGGSKKFQEASDELRIHMAMRQKITRLSEMLVKSEQVSASMRELLSTILVDLDKQGDTFMNRVESSQDVPSSSEPPPPPAVSKRPSGKPTVHMAAVNAARVFEKSIRDRFRDAKSEADRELAFEYLRRGVQEYPNDLPIQRLEAEFRR